MRTLIIGLVVLMLTGSMVAQPSRQDPIKQDLNGIQGTWKIVALEVDGQQAPTEIVATLKLVFKDDTLMFTPGEPGFTNYKFKLDPASKPAGFAMTHADGTQKGKTDKGIYALESDRLKICFCLSGKIPKEFTVKARSGQWMYSLEREK
ncbi:MAG: TIGR03067 domain-containing protein [Verrucomicrobiia bacterium]